MTRPFEAETEQLLVRAGAGEAGAAAELLARNRTRLKRMFAVRLDDRLAARIDDSDVVQETLAEAAAQLPAFLAGPPGPFYPWLRRIAERKLIDLCRHHKRGIRAVGREDRPPALPDRSAVELARRLVCPRSGPSRAAERREVRARVTDALAALDEKEREVLVLYHLERLPAREVADVLGLSVEAVRSRQRRALLKLTQELGDLRKDFER